MLAITHLGNLSSNRLLHDGCEVLFVCVQVLGCVLATTPQARGTEAETFRAEVELGVDAEVEAQLQGWKSSSFFI